MLHPVLDLMPLRVIEPIQGPHQIPGDPADALEVLPGKPEPLEARSVAPVNELRLYHLPLLRFLHVPNLLKNVVGRESVLVNNFNVIQCISPLYRNRLKQIHLRVEIPIAADSNISSVHILQVGFLQQGYRS